jgi:HTH-type transcriptional regulator, competence development regulator
VATTQHAWCLQSLAPGEYARLVSHHESPLPELLKSLRSRAGLTLREVEQRTDGQVSNAYLSQLESGRRPSPHPRILTALAHVYGAAVEQLFEAAGYVDAPTPSEIDRAFAMVMADEAFKFGTRAPGELTQEARRMFVEMYEHATGRKLLGDGGESDQTPA